MMGKTAFDGPVYGGKCLLWSYGPYTQTGTTGATTVLFHTHAYQVVPAYEDWLITEVTARASSVLSTIASGHAWYLKSEGGSTTILPRAYAPGNGSTRAQTLASLVTTGGSSNSTVVTAAVTADAKEYEGAWVPAGSSLRIVSSGVINVTGLQVNVMGYIRYIDSTRAQ
jgi:hypothetical protein